MLLFYVFECSYISLHSNKYQWVFRMRISWLFSRS